MKASLPELDFRGRFHSSPPNGSHEKVPTFRTSPFFNEEEKIIIKCVQERGRGGWRCPDRDQGEGEVRPREDAKGLRGSHQEDGHRQRRALLPGALLRLERQVGPRQAKSRLHSGGIVSTMYRFLLLLFLGGFFWFFLESVAGS